jgi:pilin isopeptide linkage protein/LPXTG-motif cell wall-anchored protein
VPLFENKTVGDLTVNKTISGNGAVATDEFGFRVTLSDTTVNGTYGDMEFINGVATFTLKGGESKTASGLLSGTEYTVEETDAKGYTSSVNGQETDTATGSIIGHSTEAVTFNNAKYTAVTVVLTAKKTLDGATPTTNDFSFVLKDSDGQELQTKTNNGDTVTFDALTFDKTGTYTYTVSEVAGDNSKISYDSSVYEVIIEVTLDGDGYQTTVTYQNQDKTSDEMIFSNTTLPEPPVSDPDPEPEPDTPISEPESSEPTPSNTPVSEPTESEPTVSQTDVPHTGDESTVNLWVILFAISFIGLAGFAVIALRKKKNENQD